jgi:hypothetical protein
MSAIIISSQEVSLWVDVRKSVSISKKKKEEMNGRVIKWMRNIWEEVGSLLLRVKKKVIPLRVMYSAKTFSGFSFA